MVGFGWWILADGRMGGCVPCQIFVVPPKNPSRLHCPGNASTITGRQMLPPKCLNRWLLHPSTVPPRSLVAFRASLIQDLGSIR